MVFVHENCCCASTQCIQYEVLYIVELPSLPVDIHDKEIGGGTLVDVLQVGSLSSIRNLVLHSCTEVLRCSFSLLKLLFHKSKGSFRLRFLWISSCDLYCLPF